MIEIMQYMYLGNYITKTVNMSVKEHDQNEINIGNGTIHLNVWKTAKENSKSKALSATLRRQ